MVVRQNQAGTVGQNGSLKHFARVHDGRIQAATADRQDGDNMIFRRKRQSNEFFIGEFGQLRLQYRQRILRRPHDRRGIDGDSAVADEPDVVTRNVFPGFCLPLFLSAYAEIEVGNVSALPTGRSAASSTIPTNFSTLAAIAMMPRRTASGSFPTA